MKRLVVLVLLAVPATAAAEGPWDYMDPGDLISGSGQGAEDWTVFAPDMRFPIEEGPAFANSQVYMPGGMEGGGGGQCDAVNYDYPWRDNYCETRSWDKPLCPSGTGHQGQDLRPATCDKSLHYTVAAADGTITNIGSYSVYLTAADGTRYDYLHTDSLEISSGQSLQRGERMSRVSNAFGGTPTTIHLHFNIRQDVAGVGFVYVPPYMSLVQSYEKLMGFGVEQPGGALEASDCTSIRGWAQDPDLPDEAVEVEVWFDGGPGDPDAMGIATTADRYREDLCDTLGSCDHGFELEVPRSFRDDRPHEIHVYAGDSVELDASPGTIDCPLPTIPDGVRRLVASPEVLAAWRLSTVWDLANVDDATMQSLEEWEPLPLAPMLAVSDANTQELWLLDGEVRRLVASAAVAEAWRFDATTAETWPADELSEWPEGTEVREAPFLIRGSDQRIYLIDDEQCLGGADCDEGSPGTEGDGDDGGDGGDDGAGEGGDDGGEDPDGPALPPSYGVEQRDDGCGCTARAGFPGWALWALVVAARRRRARRAEMA